MGNVPCASGRRVWMEQEIKVFKVTRYDPDKGKTGKGHLYITDAETGQQRCFDVEDICGVYPGRQLTRQGKSAHE